MSLGNFFYNASMFGYIVLFLNREELPFIAKVVAS